MYTNRNIWLNRSFWRQPYEHDSKIGVTSDFNQPSCVILCFEVIFVRFAPSSSLTPTSTLFSIPSTTFWRNFAHTFHLFKFSCVILTWHSNVCFCCHLSRKYLHSVRDCVEKGSPVLQQQTWYQQQTTSVKVKLEIALERTKTMRINEATADIVTIWNLVAHFETSLCKRWVRNGLKTWNEYTWETV